MACPDAVEESCCHRRVEELDVAQRTTETVSTPHRLSPVADATPSAGSPERW